MLPAFVVPYLVGLVSAPVARAVVKPLVRGTVKTAIGTALQVRKLAAEAAEDLQDLAAEASAEFATMAAQIETKPEVPAPSSRAGGRSGISMSKKS